MTDSTFLTRQALAARWRVSLRTIDRLKARGRLPWVDFSTSDGRTCVRFRLDDVIDFERKMRRPDAA